MDRSPRACFTKKNPKSTILGMLMKRKHRKLWCQHSIAKRRPDKREHCIRPICWQFLVVFVRRGTALNSFYVCTSPWCFILIDSFSWPMIVKCCSCCKAKFLKAFGICIDDLYIYVHSMNQHHQGNTHHTKIIQYTLSK